MVGTIDAHEINRRTLAISVFSATYSLNIDQNESLFYKKTNILVLWAISETSSTDPFLCPGSTSRSGLQLHTSKRDRQRGHSQSSRFLKLTLIVLMWRRSLKPRSSLIFDYHDQPP